MSLLAITALALVSASLGCALFIPLAPRLRLMDAPVQRSAHRVVTPSSGGVVIILALLFALAAAWLTGIVRPPANAVTLLAGLGGVCVLGAWDDRRALPVRVRLPLFFLIAALVVSQFTSTGGSAADTPGGALWLLPLLVLAFAWLLNLYNFMDGIDGLAALQCVWVAACLGVMGLRADAPGAFVLLSAVTAGSYGGFLLLNWPPARLFMGDAGSLSAGYLLGLLGLWGWRDGFLPVAAWVLLMSPFLLDATFTLLLRAWRGERLTEAHSTHVYQRLARNWASGHRGVAVALLVLQLLWLTPLSVAALFELAPQWTLMALGLFPQLFLIAKSQRFT